MKQTLLTSLTMVAMAGTIAAQTITIDDFPVQIGTTYTQGMADYVDPGSSGINQTWDLSGMNTQMTAVTTVHAPASQSGHENFPNASFAMVVTGQTEVGFVAITEGKYEIVGMYSADGLMTYPDPMTQLQFPLSYQTTYTDTYERYVDFGGGIANQEIGNHTMVVDGTGTLITPAGTFTNVLRIKQTLEASLNTIMEGDVISELPITQVMYVYVKAGYVAPLASMVTFEMAGQTSQSGVYYVDATVGLDEVDGISDLSVFPMPVEKNFTVGLHLEHSAQVHFNLYSIDGRMVAPLGNHYLPQGENTRTFNLPDGIAKGIYLLQIETDKARQVRRIAVR